MRATRWLRCTPTIAGLLLAQAGCDGPSATGANASTGAQDSLPTTPTQSVGTPTLARTVIVSGLSSPWDIAFAADGAMFFTERCRGVTVRRVDGTTTRLFGTTGSALVAPDLVCEGQSGVHGIALDPGFATNRTLYVYMLSTLSTAPRTNRVVRLVLNSGYTSASNRTDIITDIASKDVGNGVGGAGSHSGGRLRFASDGLLYVATGDNHNATLPQDPARLGGKVLRVTTSGAAAPGNVPPAGFDLRIFTYGHRNVQGVTFRPGTGQPFTSEHGPNHSDEVTPLVNGGNGGWDPKNRSGLSCPDGYCGYAGNAATMPMTDVARFPQACRRAGRIMERRRGWAPRSFSSARSGATGTVGWPWGSWEACAW
jgi:glucose/arabinose dehydrogenase